MAGLVQLLPQDLIDEIKNKVIELFDKTLQEQASKFTDKLAGEVAKNMEPIFKGPGVQLAANQKFMENINPVYDKIINNHIEIVKSLQEQNTELANSINELKTNINNNPSNTEPQVKTFFEKLRSMFPLLKNKDGTPYKSGGAIQGGAPIEYPAQNALKTQQNHKEIIGGLEKQMEELKKKQAEQEKFRVEQSHYGCNKLKGGKKTKNKHKRKPKQRKTRRV